MKASDDATTSAKTAEKAAKQITEQAALLIKQAMQGEVTAKANAEKALVG